MKVPSFEIGYWAHSAYTGRGYITEAVIGLRDFAFDILHAHRLQIVVNRRTHAVRPWRAEQV